VCALTHKRSHEVWALVWSCWSKDGADVATMCCTYDRILVFIAYPAVVGEGFGEPIGGADEGRFGVDVLMCRQYLGSEKTTLKMLTSALCCWPVP